MKKYFIITILIIGFISSCKKDLIENKLKQKNSNINIEEAKAFLSNQSSLQTNSNGNSNFDLSSLLSEIDWKNASNIDNDKVLIGLAKGQPKENGTKIGFRKAVFFKDSLGKVDMEIFEFLPDVYHLWKYGGIKRDSYDGKVFIYDKAYNLKRGYLYRSGKIIGDIKPYSQSNSPKVESVPKTNVVVSTCSQSIQVYLSTIGNYEVYVLETCSSTYIPDYYGSGGSSGDIGSFIGAGGGDGGGATGITPAPIPELFILGQDQAPIDIKKFVKCFGSTHNLDDSYKFTVYVDQPINGSTASSYGGNVGHTFIGVTKSNNTGTFTQYIGFYPENQLLGALPLGHAFKDNGSTDYDVSISFNIPYADFESLLTALNNYNQDYNVWNHNCTDYALEMANAAGVYVPNSHGNTFISRTPGQLGEDLRQYKRENPGIGVNDNGGQTGKSKGPCN